MALKTLRASGGDFSTLESWVAYLPSTLTEDEILEIYDDWPSGLVAVASLSTITTAPYNITIRAALGHGNDGVIDQGVLLTNNVNWSPVIDVRVANVTVENISLSKSAVEAPLRVAGNISLTCKINRVIAKNTLVGTEDTIRALYTQQALITNCIVYDSNLGIYQTNWYALNIHNCLIYNCTTGIYSASTGAANASTGLEVENTVFLGCVNDDGGTSVRYSVTNNASNSTNTSDLGADCDRTITLSDFTDPVNHDFTLPPTSKLIGAGVDKSSLYTTDITGATRTVPWDIGVFKYTASGGGITGSAAATELSADTASISGEIGTTTSTGALSSQENSTDTLQIQAELLVSGNLNGLEVSTDSLSSTGNTQFETTGNISSSEPATDNYLSNGVVVENGTITVIEPATDTLLINGNVLINGQLIATEQSTDTAAISGSSKITGLLSAVEVTQDLAQINGSVLVSGLADMSETGVDSALINGVIVVSGGLNASEQNTDIFSASGSGILGGILSTSEAATDTADVQGLIYVQGSVNATEAQLDTAIINGIVINTGSINAIEPFNDLFVAFGGPVSTGSMLLVEPNTDLLLANGGAATLGNLSVQELSIDDSAMAGQVIVSGVLPVVESSIDSFLSIGEIPSTGNLTALEQETDSVEMGLTAEDFIDFVDTVYIKSQNNQVMVNNHNTEIYQR